MSKAKRTVIPLLAGALLATACSTEKMFDDGASRPSLQEAVGTVAQAISCPGSSDPAPYVSYCGAKAGRIFVTMPSGSLSLTTLGTYTPPANLATVGPGEFVTLRAWIDTTHNGKYNAAVDPFQEVTVQAHVSTGVVTYPNFELQDPLNIYVPANAPFVVPTDEGALAMYEPLIDANRVEWYGAYAVTATPDVPSGTCVSRTIQVRAGGLDRALFANLDNTCTYTFSYGGVHNSIAMTHGPGTSSVTIGTVNPGGSYSVTGDMVFGALSSLLTASSRAFILARSASGGALASILDPQNDTSYTLNLLDDDYTFFAVVDFNGDGEIARWEVRPETDGIQQLPVTVNGANLTGQDITLSSDDITLTSISIHEIVDGDPDTYRASINIRDLNSAIVNAAITGETGFTPSTLSTDIGLWFPYTSTFWGANVQWGASAPALSSAEYTVTYEIDDPPSESGAATNSSPRTLAANITNVVEDIVTNVVVTPASTPDVTWDLPAGWGSPPTPPGGCTILVQIGHDTYGGSSGHFIASPPEFSSELPCTDVDYTFTELVTTGVDYVASVEIHDGDGNYSANMVPFTP